MPTSDVHGERVPGRVAAVVPNSLRLHAGQFAGGEAVAAVEDPVLIVEHDGVFQSALTDAGGEVGDAFLVEHGEQVGDGVDAGDGDAFTGVKEDLGYGHQEATVSVTVPLSLTWYHWRSDSWLTAYPQRAETRSAIHRHDVPSAIHALTSAPRSPGYLSSRSVCFGEGMGIICH